MHKDRILALADLIEQQPHTEIESRHGFNMMDYTHHCGTPACIAGWAAAVADGAADGKECFNEGISIWFTAADYLGLEEKQAHKLFKPDTMHPSEWVDVTPTRAAHTLRHLAKTSEVDWTAYDRREQADA